MDATIDRSSLVEPEGDSTDSSDSLLLSRTNPYTKFLPYASELDQEADLWFADIKRGIAHSIEMCDLKTSANSWINQLQRYIRVYGRRFSKEDHVRLVNLLYAIVCDTKLDVQLTIRFADLLSRLLKKPDLLRPSELTLEWRPVYDLYRHVALNKYVAASIVSHPDNALKSVVSLVRCCRPYFPVNSTREILTELRPFFSPYAIKFSDQITVAELFLPTSFENDADRAASVSNWYDEMVRFFLKMYNSSNKLVVQLLARMAQDSVGRIDWTPVMDSVFTRILRTFNLPVGEYHLKPLEDDDEVVDTLYYAAWVLAMLGGETAQSAAAFRYLESLLTAVGSFTHPSNSGKWTSRINKFISQFVELLTERLFRERLKSKSKNCWFMLVPPEVYISDKEVTKLVELIKPILFQTMFGKQLSLDVFSSLRLLANLRPELILPSLLERVWPAFETLTEPHRLHSCLQALLHTSHALICSTRFFPEGRTHVIPILNACLPGIDFNDINKCLYTFQLISSIVSMIPLIDCSDLANEDDRERLGMTDIEYDLCGATAQFEDFVEQFLDRTFAVIGANTLSFQAQLNSQSQTSTTVERLNLEESILEIGIASTFISILQSASASLRHRAVDKLFRFVSEHVFEIKLSGRLIAKMCKSAAKVDAGLVVPVFVPYLLRRIDEILQSDEFKDEEEPDDRLLWFYKLLGDLASTSGGHIIAYKRELVSVLQRTLHLKCTRVSMLACDVLSNTLATVTQTTPVKFGSFDNDNGDRNGDSKNFAVRDWGRTITLKELKVQWRTPNEKDAEFVREVIEILLPPELSRIDRFVRKEIELKKEELATILDVLGALLEGAAAFLEPLQVTETIQLGDGVLPISDRALIVSNKQLQVDLAGKNVRQLVLDSLLRLVDYFELHRKDDTKSLRMVLDVLYSVFSSIGTRNDDHESRMKGQKAIKRMMENRLLGKKKHLRMIHVERCILQHSARVSHSIQKRFSIQHKTSIQLLFRLSLNRYSDVRKKAQQVLFRCCATFWYSATLIVEFASEALDQIVIELKQFAADRQVANNGNNGAIVAADNNGSNERKKQIDCKLEGVVHTVYGLLKNNQYAMTCHSAWRARAALWPKLMQIEHPDSKLAAQIDELIDRILKSANTVHLENHFNPQWVEIARQLDDSDALESRLSTGREYLARKNKEQRDYYSSIERDLHTLLKSTNLSSKHVDLTAEFIAALIQPDIPLNVETVRFFVELSVNDVQSIRSLCLDVLYCVLMLIKKKRSSTKLDAASFIRERTGLQVDLEHVTSRVPPGLRKDNAFLCYDCEENVYESEAKFAQTCGAFVDKSHLSYYCWPTTLEVFAAQSGIVTIDTPTEKLILDFFTDERNLKVFFQYLADEDHKKYALKNMQFFKYFFRNFGFAPLAAFKPFVERLVYETNEQRIDYAHRTAAEFLAGLVRGGIRNFSMPQLVEMWRWVLPLFDHVLNAKVVGAHEEWVTTFAAISENVDPRRLAPLVALLLNRRVEFSAPGEAPAIRIGNTANEEKARLIVPGKRLHQNAMRISFIQAFLNQQDWRVPLVWRVVRDSLYTELNNPYKLIRDRIGNTFATMFAFDFRLVDPSADASSSLIGSSDGQPRAVEFVEFILPQLNSLCASYNNGAGSGNDAVKSDTESVGSFVVVPKPAQQDVEVDEDTDESNLSADDIEMIDRSCSSSPETKEDANAKSIRLLKTVLRMLQALPDNSFEFNVNFCRLLPVVCQLHSEQASSNPELRQLTSAVIQTVSTVHLGYSSAEMDVLLDVLNEISKLQSHSAKKALLVTLQALVYHNLLHFVPMSTAASQRIVSLVVNLLQDQHPEVRVRASSTLSGFVRCGLAALDATLLSTFDRLSSTKLANVPSSATGGTTALINSPALINRHAGVLGYCACVEAFPYDVPPFLPVILMKLNAHLNDPQPINTTIRKTLSNFKRTHYDNWYEHKQKFTDDQLVTITDMLISPNYYA